MADDGSTDDTRNIVEELATRDRRVRYVYQENRGGGDARNLGASVSSGRYITFIDSDDEVAPTWLKKFNEAFQEPDNVPENRESWEALAASEGGREYRLVLPSPSRPKATDSPFQGRWSVHVVCCGQHLIDHQGALARSSLPQHGGLFLSGTFAIRRITFDAIGGYAPALPASQHSELKYRLLPLCERNGWRIASVDEPLAIRHLHNDCSIRKNYEAVYESCLYILREHEQFLRINPRNYANWATLCAMSAVQLRRFTEARIWLARAIRTRPQNWRNYARFAVASTPLLRSVVWRKAPNTDL